MICEYCNKVFEEDKELKKHHNSSSNCRRLHELLKQKIKNTIKNILEERDEIVDSFLEELELRKQVITECDRQIEEYKRLIRYYNIKISNLTNKPKPKKVFEIEA
jgi:hypothetical protein